MTTQKEKIENEVLRLKLAMRKSDFQPTNLNSKDKKTWSEHGITASRPLALIVVILLARGKNPYSEQETIKWLYQQKKLRKKN